MAAVDELDLGRLEQLIYERLSALFGLLAQKNYVDLAQDARGILPIANSGITYGTQCVKNPVVVSSVTTQAHALGRKPDTVLYWLECLTGELGYSAGDRTICDDSHITVAYDATNTLILIDPGPIPVHRKDTGANANITVGNWKVVAQPMLLQKVL